MSKIRGAGVWRGVVIGALLWLVIIVAVYAMVKIIGGDHDDQSAQQRAREDAYVTALAAVHGVPELDRGQALASGRNACYWVDRYGLDRATLAGWQRYWSQPWEGEWLRLSVELLCPAEGGG